MTPFFSRVKLAFAAFFSILFRDRVPDLVASTYQAAAAPGAARIVKPADVTPEATATQMLAVLQRDGRLVDFLMEDIAPYADAQIGAAVRNVHAGCRQALDRYLTLAPVMDREEGSRVTIDAGTDPSSVKIIGHVAGAPASGVLRHRGWLMRRAELPALPPAIRSLVAPAEVEVS